MDAPDWLQDEGAARQIGYGLQEIDHKANRETIERYLKERHVNGVKDKTLVNHVHALRDLAQDLGDKRFEDATKEDVVDHFADATRTRKWRNKSDDGEITVTEREVTLSDNTLAVRKQIVRRFYKWLFDGEGYPDAVKDIKPKRRSPDMIPTDKLISKDDLQTLIETHDHPRDKAIIAVLFESGMRAGEFVSLEIRNVEFDQYGAVLTLPKDATGLKTGGAEDPVDRLRFLPEGLVREPSPQGRQGRAALDQHQRSELRLPDDHQLAVVLLQASGRAG